MKKLILVSLIAIVCTFTANAQEKGKIRGGADLGWCLPKGGGGLSFNINLGYNLADNINVGIRYGSALMAKEINDTEGKLTANVNYLATGNYYFNKGTSSFAPFVGAGAGYYSLGGLSVGDNTIGAGTSGKFGGMVTAGFELGKFRLGVEYDLIPSSKYKAADLGAGTTTTSDFSVSNSYAAVTVGFYIGGGKWKK